MSLVEFGSLCGDPWLAANLATIELRYTKKYGTAREAKRRLRTIIAEDRAAVPCGRWVPKYPDWEHWKHLPCPVPKLHYRYEVRR